MAASLTTITEPCPIEKTFSYCMMRNARTAGRRSNGVGMTLASNLEEYEFDVALSFAGEDRELVEDVNRSLQAVGVQTFLDADHLSEMWGEDLVEFFDDLFRKRARYALLFLSRHYADKTWPRHERRSALSRAVEERGPYILPARLDDTPIDGLRPSVGYLDVRRIGIDRLVSAVVDKVSGKSLNAIDSWPGDRTPRTAAEVEQVLAARPPGWEYLYFAGILLLERNAAEDQFLDHEMGYAAPSNEHIPPGDVSRFLDARIDRLRSLIRTLTALLNPEVQLRAFGVAGAQGDPARIRRLAMRMSSTYQEMMTWTAVVRSVGRDDNFDALFSIFAKFSDRPIAEYRAFLESFIDSVDQLPRRLASGEQVRLESSLVLTADDDLARDFSAEIARLKTSRATFV